MNIIACAFELESAVKKLYEKVKKFYYRVLLAGYQCPECGDSLVMAAEGLCRCKGCGNEFDPTVELQSCVHCGGKVRLRVSRYFCGSCRQEVVSKFLFDGRVYDRQYFAERMAKSRQQKRIQREQLKQKVIQCRSNGIQAGPVDSSSIADLLAAIDGLTKGIEPEFKIPEQDRFNLNLYERHIQAHIGDFAVNLKDMPSIHENKRKDLIWRFIAVIFLAHAGIVEIEQDGLDIMVMKNETYGKRQGVSGEFEETGEFKRSVGRIET